MFVPAANDAVSQIIDALMDGRPVGEDLAGLPDQYKYALAMFLSTLHGAVLTGTAEVLCLAIKQFCEDAIAHGRQQL